MDTRIESLISRLKAEAKTNPKQREELMRLSNELEIICNRINQLLGESGDNSNRETINL